MRVLASEHRHEPIRINALVLGTPIISRSRPEGDADWLTSEEVVSTSRGSSRIARARGDRSSGSIRAPSSQTCDGSTETATMIWLLWARCSCRAR